MDTAKLKLILILLAFPSFSAHAALFDMSEHSGIIKDSTSNFYKVNAAGTVSALQSGTNLTLSEKVTFPTSKGSFAADLSRTVAVEVPRLGKAVRSLAVAAGPVGMTISAVSLVCELTTICQEGSDWLFGVQTTILDGAVSCTSVAGSTIYTKLVGSTYFDYKRIPCGDSIPSGWGFVSNCNCPFDDKIIQSTGYGTLPPAPHVPTSSDWDSKESLLNDDRFISELLSVNAPVPVGNPSLSAPVTVPIGSNTKTVKDANGNVTGTETTTSEAVLDLPSSGENPSGSPTIIKIVENHTTNNYNTNNELTGSTTTTSGGTEQQQPQSQSVEIEIDNIEATPLQERAVPFPFDTDSWGSGSCPADRTVNYHYGTLNLTFEPACQFAEGIKPIVLILAGFIAMFIIMGGTKDAN